MVARGSYCLCIKVQEKSLVHVGALGKIRFEPGNYVYVGSALNGLYSRVRRHINTSNRIYEAIHWHIDYLLKEPSVEIECVYVDESMEKKECKISEKLSHLAYCIPGFGCSDCNCKSHLYAVSGFDILEELGLQKREVVLFED